MEIVIPAAAILGLWEMKKKSKKKEGFSTQKLDPATFIPSNRIEPPNTSINSYSTNTLHKERNNLVNLENTPVLHGSLTGDHKEYSEFEHLNMAPFFGSKMTQQDVIENKSILDNLQGSGSNNFSKEASAPLFKPEQNMHWPNGMPSSNDFLQSRQHESLSNQVKMQGVKPFQSMNVGPNLDSDNKNHGYNLHLDERNKYEPLNVDKLRTVDNPKISYEGGFGPAGSNTRGRVTKQQLGEFNKNKPERFSNLGPDRYFTTTGLEKEKTYRSHQILPEENRQTTSTEYYGVGVNENKKEQLPKTYNPSNRPELASNFKYVRGANANNWGETIQNDQGKSNYKILNNNRAVDNKTFVDFKPAGGVWQAVVAPVMDALRPVIHYFNPNGGNQSTFGGTVAPNGSQSQVFNYNDRLKVTNRQMSECNKMNMVPTSVNSKHQARNENPVTYGQQRDTTSQEYTGGPGGYSGTYTKNQYLEMNINQAKEDSVIGRSPNGSMQLGALRPNIKMDKIDRDRKNPTVIYPTKLGNNSANPSTLGTSTRTISNVEDMRNYNDPSMINSLKSNPYSLSITS